MFADADAPKLSVDGGGMNDWREVKGRYTKRLFK